MRAVVDIETDAINATKIHCIVARSKETGQTRHWIGDECRDFREWSKKIDTFIMHNGISFDAPVLNRLLGCNIKLSQIRDTLIESQLYNPIRDGGHSLEAWGKTLGFEKGDFHDSALRFLTGFPGCYGFFQHFLRLVGCNDGVDIAAHDANACLNKAPRQQRHADRQYRIGNEAGDFFVFFAFVQPV